MTRLTPDVIRRLMREQYEEMFDYVDGRQETLKALTAQQRQQLRNLLTALDAGTATNAQVQAAVAKLIRMELREP